MIHATNSKPQVSNPAPSSKPRPISEIEPKLPDSPTQEVPVSTSNVDAKSYTNIQTENNFSKARRKRKKRKIQFSDNKKFGSIKKVQKASERLSMIAMVSE